MLSIKTQKRFEKDLARIKKRKKNLDKLWNVISLLQAEKNLPEKCHPHRLVGTWSKFWECHVEPDWLLIYRCTDTHLELIRTGTHSDLF